MATLKIAFVFVFCSVIYTVFTINKTVYCRKRFVRVMNDREGTKDVEQIYSIHELYKIIRKPFQSLKYLPMAGLFLLFIFRHLNLSTADHTFMIQKILG